MHHSSAPIPAPNPLYLPLRLHQNIVYDEAQTLENPGAILENYFIAEKIKLEANASQKANFYFWRTHDQKEIDFLAEKNSKIEAFEIKLKGQGKPSVFQAFKSVYPQSSFKLITLENLIDSLLPSDA